MTENNNKGNFLDIAVLIGALVYFITPIDLIPDVTPLGFIDDTTLLTMAFNSAKSLFSSSDIAKANEKAAKLLGNHFDAEKATKMAQQIISNRKK